VARLRPGIVLALVALACLALAATAAAKPRKSALVVSAPKSAKLAVGQTTKMKVKVADRGHSALAGVVLLARPSKGVAVKPAKVKVGRLAPGKSAVETFKVTATKAGKPRLAFLARASGQPKATDRVALKVGSAGGESPKAASAIVGRYFWRSELILQTTYLHAYYFVDEHWVYRGMLEHGVPSCTSQTANGEEDGCLPYTWDEKTGALNIAGTTGEFNPATRTFKVDETGYSEAVPAAAGTKVDASGEYINGFGICPLSCSFTTVELEMSSSGEFAKAAGVVGFFGEGGSYGALPPEDHGTYSIPSRGNITFNYADGHTESTGIAFMLDEANNPDPNYGILLGDFDFFGPHSGV
jgi:hypothetical protein